MNIAKLLSSIHKLGYDIDTSYQVFPVTNLVEFNTNNLYFEKLENGNFQLVNNSSTPLTNVTYYKVEETNEDVVVDALLREYERFFGITPESELTDRYSIYENTEIINFEKLTNLEVLYNKIGIDTNNIYYKENNVYKKVEKPTLKLEEDFAEAVLGLTLDVEFTKRILNLNSEEIVDTSTLYIDNLTTRISDKLKNYIYYTNKNITFSITDTLISIFDKIGKNIIAKNEDTITINPILTYTSFLESQSLDTRLERIKESLVSSNLTPEEYFTLKEWKTPIDGEILTLEQTTKNINILEDLFNGNKLSTFTVKKNENFERYNFIDLTAIERLKDYIDEYMSNYLSKELYSNSINLKLNEVNNKLNSIIKDVYNSSNINSENNFKTLSKKIKDINTTLEGIGYNISPSYNIKLPKVNNPNTYIFSNSEGKAMIGYFSETVEPGDCSPVSSRAVYEKTKLFHKNGDCAGFGKIERNNIKEYEKIFDKTNVLNELSTVPLDYSISSNPRPYFILSSNYFSVPNKAKVIYIPVVRGGNLIVEFFENISSIQSNLKLAKNQESLFKNLNDRNAFISGDYSNNKLSFVFDDNNIFKRADGVDYIGLVNKENLKISKIIYKFNKDNILRIDKDGILANKEMVLATNSFIGRKQNSTSITDTKYSFSSDTALNNLI